ncbi:MAG TPA: glyoxylate/hydroxypyruvate reductase A, partial [Rhizobiales bacterium]|nr:glyoxylate/hydroxypyruvate reductase A [Hyphomicrobiales bacterium]
DIRLWPDRGNTDDIDYALLWRPRPEMLTRLPGLKAIFSLGAGVDHLLGLETLPANVPVVRITEDDLTSRMSEYVVLHVLRHHRRLREYEALAARREWRELAQPAACEVRVGILGLGHLGRDAAQKLKMMGFQVAGWSRTAKQLEGIETFAGAKALTAFLGRSDILVCLLPLTPQTRGILNSSLFARLARDGAGKGPVLINAGRGGLQVEDDILKALDDGTLYEVTLDVFETEPLPQTSALWTHERVSITPHNAAPSTPEAICTQILTQIRRFEAGEALENLVDTKRGY